MSAYTEMVITSDDYVGWGRDETAGNGTYWVAVFNSVGEPVTAERIMPNRASALRAATETASVLRLDVCACDERGPV